MQVYPNAGAVMHIKRGFMIGSALLACVLMFMATSGMAQTTDEELVRALKPAGMKHPWRVKIESESDREAVLRYEHKLNVSVEFKFNSDRVTAAGERQLKALGEALKDPDLRDLRFVLAGHADSRGGLEFNQLLSERRANAVKRYLTRVVGIDPTRLILVGLGKSRPLDPAAPGSAHNRRVEVMNLIN